MTCYSPITVRDGEATVSCGKCPPCLYKRAAGWAFRINETVNSDFTKIALFTTLTYDNDHVPLTGNNMMTLEKKHMFAYMKKIRKLNPGSKLKYFSCGEYGSQYERPHYHQLLINAEPETVAEAWPHGYVHVEQLKGGAITYVLKYMQKPHKVPKFNGDLRLPEFQLMSKGLGEQYLTPAMIEWHHADIENRVYLPDHGKKVSMPRYYKNKIYSPEQIALVNVKLRERALEAMQLHQSHMIANYGNDWERVEAERRYAEYRRMYKSATQNRQL